jgi:hypothetical protein
LPKDRNFPEIRWHKTRQAWPNDSSDSHLMVGGRFSWPDDIIPSRVSCFFFAVPLYYLRSGMGRDAGPGSIEVYCTCCCLTCFQCLASGRGNLALLEHIMGGMQRRSLTKFVLYESCCRSRGRSQMQGQCYGPGNAACTLLGLGVRCRCMRVRWLKG